MPQAQHRSCLQDLLSQPHLYQHTIYMVLLSISFGGGGGVTLLFWDLFFALKLDDKFPPGDPQGSTLSGVNFPRGLLELIYHLYYVCILHVQYNSLTSHQYGRTKFKHNIH